MLKQRETITEVRRSAHHASPIIQKNTVTLRVIVDVTPQDWTGNAEGAWDSFEQIALKLQGLTKDHKWTVLGEERQQHNSLILDGLHK